MGRAERKRSETHHPPSHTKTMGFAALRSLLYPSYASFHGNLRAAWLSAVIHNHAPQVFAQIAMLEETTTQVDEQGLAALVG